MRGSPVYKDISLQTVRFEKVFEEIGQKSFTGFIQVKYWDTEDFIYFLKGKSLGAIRHLQQGRREPIDPFPYKPKDSNGVFSMYSTSPIEVFAFKESLEDRITPYTFVPYGYELVAPIQISLTEPNSLLEEVQSLGVYGYMVLAGNDGFEAFIGFAGGEPIFLYRGRSFSFLSQEEIALDLQDSYVGAFRTDPEFVNLLASLSTLRKVKTLAFKSSEDIRAEISKIKDGYYLLEFFISYGFRLFMLMGEGNPLLKLFNDCGRISENQPLPKEMTNYLLRVYTVELKTQMIPIKINFTSSAKEKAYVSIEVISAIKKAFVEEIGPIGPFIWKRVFEKLGFEVNKVPEDQLNELLKALALEIPDEKHRHIFIEKTRRWTP
ncbi:MAG: hypothetical protein ACK4OF_07290 [Aquificaceae bacterium]